MRIAKRAKKKLFRNVNWKRRIGAQNLLDTISCLYDPGDNSEILFTQIRGKLNQNWLNSNTPKFTPLHRNRNNYRYRGKFTEIYPSNGNQNMARIICYYDNYLFAVFMERVLDTLGKRTKYLLPSRDNINLLTYLLFICSTMKSHGCWGNVFINGRENWMTFYPPSNTYSVILPISSNSNTILKESHRER